MLKKFIYYKSIGLMLLATFSMHTYAAINTCSNITLGSYMISAGQITVQRDSAVGSALTNKIYGPKGDFTCSQVTTSPWPYLKSLIRTPLVYSGISDGGAKIWNSNVDGLGIAIGFYNFMGGYSDEPWIGTALHPNSGSYWTTGWGNNYGEVTFTVQPFIKFYKISNDLKSSSVTQLIGYLSATTDDAPSDGTSKVSLPVNINGTINVVACSIRTPNLTFPIGDVLASSFGSTVGTIPTGAENTQNLGLDCDANANINVMLQGTQNPDVGTTSVLALTGQGNSDVAKGVGVQLLYNGTPLVLNNRIVLKQSAGGQETFPITARYYQTKTSVSTGKANASATLDLTYQ